MTDRILVPDDSEWPDGLWAVGPRGLPDRLFVRGRPLPRCGESVAVVGTRRPTTTGIELAEKFATALAEAGFVVVSGLAVGIDAAAHRAALEAGGHTAAVLGCGFHQRYPAPNVHLRKQIEARGTVVTEYEPEVEAQPYMFPRRNRIIVGLSKAVVVIEGGLKSGALITGQIAFDAGREVFAVPGSARNPVGLGPNHLIRKSMATLVTNPKQMFEELAPACIWEDPYRPGDTIQLDPAEERVLHTLEGVPASIEEIGKAVSDPPMAPGELMLILSKLELRGLARRTRTGRYEITEAGLRVSLETV